MAARNDAGYTLIELLIAAALMLLLTAVTSRMLADAHATIDVTVERSDVYQRARAALDTIAFRVRSAGTGPDRGGAAGPLVRWAPPVRPGRPGGNAAALSTALTTFEVLGGVKPATLAFDAPAGTTTLDFEYAAGCAAPCGFFQRMTVLVGDGRGDFDLFVLASIDAGAAVVRRLPFGTGGAYVRGSPVLPVDLRVYYLNELTRELRASDGDRSDLPAVNDVVDLTFAYLGDPQPPPAPRPPPGDENCLFDATGAARPELRTLPPLDGTLALLPPEMLDDGPWCGAGIDPFDADLLRIRAVRLSIRLQAADPANRGSAPAWFRNPGTALASSRMVRDVTLSTSITPPNLGGGR